MSVIRGGVRAGMAAKARRIVLGFTVAALVPGVLSAGPAAARVAAPDGWSAQALQTTPSVPVRQAQKPTPTPAQRAVAARAAQPYRIPKTQWPAGSATVALSAASRSTVVTAKGAPAVAPGVAHRAGSLPVTLASADSTTTAARAASVSFAPRSAALKAGVNGVLFTVSRADGQSAASLTQVSLDYSSFVAAYGGGYADRLKLVELPACALTTPKIPSCHVQRPVAFHNDLNVGTLSAQIPVGGGEASMSGSRSAGVLLAATSSASGGVGTYSATTLSPSGTWSGGGSTGDFTYSYPIDVPPTIGGAAPNVTLDYDSGSVDGRTSATNSQASWIGDGWDYAPGFIERSYQPCSQDTISNSTDQCWAGNQLQLSLGSHSSALVLDGGGAWKLLNDDGSKIIPLSGANNGAWKGEAWEVITPDGTQYYFGLNHLPTGNGSDAATQSAWTEPVYCPKAGDGPGYLSGAPACYSSSTDKNSYVANMAWRWNLDYVVDPHGNLQTYSWVPETNYYQRGYAQGNGSGTNTLYTRGGYLSTISFGYRLADAVSGTAPLDTVTFNVAERCLTNSSFNNCSYSYLTSNLSSSPATSNWPDVPADQICATQSGSCANYAPTFFTTKRLTSIATSVLVGGSPKPVDTYTLDQMFPAPEAGVVSSTSGVSATHQGDGTVAVMWLNSIKRTGNDTLGGGSSAYTPPITFVADMMPNRVDGNTLGAAALFRPRMDSITTESGSQIVVSYYPPQCSRVNNAMPASEDSNTMACFPQYWTPTSGNSPAEDWFNKYQVQEVAVNDLVAPAGWSEAQVVSYRYGNAAWHRDDSPLTPSAQRTWNQFRGYSTVTTTIGAASLLSVATQTVTTYLQGMDGDHLKSGATRSVTVSDSVGDTVTDSPWLHGQILETQSLLGAGGMVEKKTVNGPWTYTTTASETQANSMPPLVARMIAASENRSYALWHDGTWRKTETDTAYDSSGRVTTSDAKGDGTSADPEVCTATSYAQDTGRNMLSYPSRTTSVQGSCGTTATASNTVADGRVFYDSSAKLGSLTGPGDPTTTDAIDSYDASGNPVYVTQKQASFDAYGRVLSVTDADNHTTSSAYSAPGASPETMTVTNPKGWTSTTTLDPARGLTIAATDVNNELTTQTYDGLGRLTAVWSPLHAQASNAPADKTFAYSVTGTAPTTVSTSTLLDTGTNQYQTDVKIYDGQLRVIQEQAPTADSSSGRLLTDTHYNSLGQIAKATSPYSNTDASPGTTIAPPANDSKVPEETETSYDGIGRLIRILTVAQGANQWSTTTAYPGIDQTDVTPPAGGTASSTFTDVLGRTIASWSYKTPGPTDKAGDAIATSYTYTPASKPATVQDAAGNTWTFTYDLHNRQVKLADPGSGTSTSNYSPAGEVLSTTDGRGSQLTYTYDVLGRKTGEYNTTGNVTTAPSNQLAEWTYDTLDKGQATAQIRYTNGANDATQTYTEAITGYTTLYQPTGTSVTLPSAEGALAGTYSDGSLYSATTSKLMTTKYSAEAGLPREGVNYAYTASGILSSFGGTYVYLNSAAYTPLGQVLQTNFGAYGKQLKRTETYDQPTGRLLTATDQLQTLTSALDAASYTYNQAGTITSESDAATADTQCFGYDQLNRLTSAWTDTGGVTSSSGSSTSQIAGIGGCVDTAPVAGKVTGGPAPYWQSYTYNALGDRVTAVNHDTSVSSSANNVTQTLSYNGYNPATGVSTAATQPDAVQAVATTGPSGTGTSSYAYDTAGNTKTRTGQSFTYDPEGRTQTVKNAATGTASSYLYAADGGLLIQRDPAANQAIAYLPYGEEIHLNTTTNTLSGLRYYTASPDGVQIVRSSTGTVTYELTDRLRTATTSVNASTLAVTRRYVDPYGQPRGTTPTNWPDQRGYLSQPTDPATALDLLGARQYDPSTGRFLSVDPVLETGDHRQMNGYSYAADNPVNGSDPTGLDDWANDPTINLPCTPATCPGNPPPTPPDINISQHVIIHANDPEAQYLQDAWKYALHEWGAVHNTDDEAQRWRQICTTIVQVCTGDLIELFGAHAGMDAALGDAGALNPFARLGTILLTGATGPGQGYVHASSLYDFSSLAWAVNTSSPSKGITATDINALASADGVTVGGCNSFVGGTKVLMADGSEEAIDQIRAGESVSNNKPGARPGTGDQAHVVSQVHVTYTDHEYTDVTVAESLVAQFTGDALRYHVFGASPHNSGGTVIGTADHLYWDSTTQSWTPAHLLHRGDYLQTQTGNMVVVMGIRTYTATAITYNLTIDQIHTYYVLAGDIPVLVHNTQCRTADGKFAKSDGSPSRVGSLDERTTLDQLETDGAPVVRGTVTVNIPGVGQRMYDGAVQIDGAWYGVETKGGTSPLTPRQQAADEWLNEPGNAATSVGANGGYALEGVFYSWVPDPVAVPVGSDSGALEW